jgi:hypothetical protein
VSTLDRSIDAGENVAHPRLGRVFVSSTGVFIVSKVISANYRDRDSKYRWLVRDEEHAPENAVACKGVKASGNIVFKRSDAYEAGWGCSRVAVCDGEVEMIGVEPSPSAPLYFDGFDFRRKIDDEAVVELKGLELTADGGMFATA